MKNSFLRVKNQSATEASLYIYGDIVGSEWERWEPDDVAPEGIRTFLDEIKGKDLNIYINSGGGSVFAGMSIYNMLKRHAGKKTVYVDGLAGSIASVIAFAGDTLIVPKNAYLMIHKAWVYAAGNSSDLRKTADDLERIDEGITNVYEENLAEGAKIEDVKALIEAETWLTGDMAANYFNIETSETLDAVACVSYYFKNYKTTPDAIEKALKEPENNEEEENYLLELELYL